jgi:hypothetical protein
MRAAVLLLVLAACGALPDPLPRVVSASPRGVVPAAGLRVEFTASDPLDPEEVLDGRRIALCLADDAAVVKRLASSDAGLGPGAPVLTASVALEDGNRRAVLVPVAPLVAGARYAGVLGPGLRAVDGRPLLDGDGKQRAIVVEFEIAPGGQPVRASITEVLADAATPEAGGEFVEVVNLGGTPLDLAGFRLAKRGTTGAFSRCTIAPRAGGPLAPRHVALVAGGAYDSRYPLPTGTPVYQCGATALLGGLANDRAPAIQLEDPAGAVVSSIGVASAAPRCPASSLQRLDPEGPDEAVNLACADAPTPGAFP